MSHEWKFGDWGKSLSGVIVRFVSNWTDQTIFVTSNGSINSLCDVEYLPDCTGWDWEPPKPIEPPPGCRFLVDGDFIRHDDLSSASNQWAPVHPVSVGQLYDPEKFFLIARKIEPQYRPFASAAEYEPFFDKVIARSEMGVVKPGGWKPIGYSDIGIYPDVSVMSYADAFEQLEFKDGTPFGVPVNVEA